MTKVKTQNSLPKGISPEQIAEWKAKYGRLVQFDIPLEDDSDELSFGEDDTPKVAQFICRKPTRDEMKPLTKYAADKDFDSFNKLMMKTCVLGGDVHYLQPAEKGGNDDVFLDLQAEMGTLFSRKKAQVKKL